LNTYNKETRNAFDAVLDWLNKWVQITMGPALLGGEFERFNNVHEHYTVAQLLHGMLYKTFFMISIRLFCRKFG